ncbi:MAG: cyclase family protein [Actinomycetota bacterium]
MSSPAGDSLLSTGWIDVSAGLSSGMVHWPGDPAVEISLAKDISKGDSSNVSQISMGSHTGTHMDAPLHFIPGAPGLDQMELAATIGVARVIAINDPESITVNELERHSIESGERILFRTNNSSTSWVQDPFATDFVYISTEAAHYLGEKKVRTVGVDYLSVGGYKKNGSDVHRALLGAGIWIIEGMQLQDIGPGSYEMICLPLRILGADGAPARAILRPLGK